MIYKNTKAMVCSPDGDIDFFDIFAGILQRDTLTSYLFIICLDYVLQSSIDLMKENDYAETISDVDYTEDLVLLVKCTSSSQISGVQPGAGSKWHWSLCEYR